MLADDATDDASQAPLPPSKVDSFFYDPQAYARNQEPAMSKEQREFVAFSAMTTRDDHTVLFPNFEMPREAMRSPHSKCAKGYAAMYSKQMPLSTFIVGKGDAAALRFSSRFEAIISVLEIPEKAFADGMTEERMRACLAALMPRIAAPAIQAVETLEQHEEHIFGGERCGAAKDSCRWEACMYGSGNFAGVYKREADAENDKDRYYIVVHSDAGPLGSALCAWACSKPDMTLGEFVNSPYMARVREFSRRNHSRLVARVVNALGLNRECFKFKDDHLAYASIENHEALPDRVGGYTTKVVYNTFHDPNPAGHSLIYYNSTCRMGGSKKYRHLVQLMGLHKGIALYGVNPGKDYTVASFDFLKEGNQALTTSHDNPFAAWPISLGSDSSKRPPRKALEKAQKRYMWIDKDDEGAPENYRLTQYRTPDEEQVRFNKFLLGKEQAPERNSVLKPVAVVLPPARQPSEAIDN